MLIRGCKPNSQYTVQILVYQLQMHVLAELEVTLYKEVLYLNSWKWFKVKKKKKTSNVQVVDVKEKGLTINPKDLRKRSSSNFILLGNYSIIIGNSSHWFFQLPQASYWVKSSPPTQ